jgi:segregation and condensation protein B
MEEQDIQQPEIRPDEPVTVEELIPGAGTQAAAPLSDAALRAVIEAIVYVAEEPLTVAQLAIALGHPAERIQPLLAELAAEFEKPEHGVAIREVAGGYKMATKAEHHEAVRAFAKSLKPPLKLSLAALETLAVIAYKQPVTVPEIQEIRGVQGAGVVKTLLERKLVVPAGRKNVIGKPILYKTTKEFLIQFGLKDLSELPSLKEFEEIRRLAFADTEPPAAPYGGTGDSPVQPAEPAAESSGEASAPAEPPSSPISEES